jgi:leader peptidase (prepilin peptidase)/N-methyltransferase
MEIMLMVFLFVFGAALGSFAMCQVWRMRAEQEEDIDHKATDKVRILREARKGRKGIEKLTKDKSICLSCGHEIAWYDKIPVVSWIMLGGRCRGCKKFIGVEEILCEVGLGAAFVLSYLFFPFKIVDFRTAAMFFIFLVSLTGFLMLFVYDMIWKRLPERPLTFCIICAILFLGVRLWGSFSVAAVIDLLGALVILPGLYFVLYKASNEKLVGAGDYVLAIPIALTLGEALPAFFALFAANLLGSVVMFPIVLRRKRRGLKAQVSFGPFLIAGFLVVFFAQNYIGGLLSI